MKIRPGSFSRHLIAWSAVLLGGLIELLALQAWRLRDRMAGRRASSKVGA